MSFPENIEEKYMLAKLHFQHHKIDIRYPEIFALIISGALQLAEAEQFQTQFENRTLKTTNIDQYYFIFRQINFITEYVPEMDKQIANGKLMKLGKYDLSW
jgi:hypothetical protein